MDHRSPPRVAEIEEHLAALETKDLVRVLTCGSVDDGKSTLIGRLLHDARLILEDQLAALEADSATSGTTGDEPDLALLLDGLQAEREQGITIDVAYRSFATPRRRFVVADAPGHVQYTRNMATGASNCELAVILVDARNGVLEQTRRHSWIAALLGVRHVVVAVNKMDLVGYTKERFAEIERDYRQIAERLGLEDVYFLPISALRGDNVVEASTEMPWFEGPPLLEHLESVDVQADIDLERLRFPVQLALRPDRDFRGFAGTVASGVLRRGAQVVALPSGVSSTVSRIVTFDGELEAAGPGRAVTVVLADEIDVSRGDLLVDPAHLPERAHDLDAMVVWMDAEEARPGRQFLLRSVAGVSNASLRAIRSRIDMSTLGEAETGHLVLNDVARCAVSVDRELVFDPYDVNRTTGSFILVDGLSNATVAAGMILEAASAWDLEPDAALSRHPSEVTEAERTSRFRQHPCTVVLTGMTGAGKSTIATALERRLFDRGHTLLRLDGEDLRLGISRDLGFSDAERSENLRRAAEIARLANQQGLITILAVQAPAASVRHRIRDLIGHERYVEVFLDASEEVRRSRDPHGLYRAADRGEIDHLPGVTSGYDRPERPDLTLDTDSRPVAACVDAVVALLVERGHLPGR